MDSFKDSFSNADLVMKQTDYLGNASEANWVYTGYLDSSDDALLLQMPNQSTGTVVSSTKYLWFGKIGASMKTSHDHGVITAMITYSDVKDEIDFESLGFNLTNPQTNYYSLGILNYTNTKNSSTSDTFQNWHYYEMDWKEDKIEWLIDGELVRTLERDDTWNSSTHRYDYPSTPSRVQFSLWPGGSTLNGLGTIEWAGGEINWNSDDIKQHGYYYAYVKNVSIEAYDLPSFLTGNYSSDYHAFLYNSTDGAEDDVYLTKDKTWLGDSDSSGLDPNNDDDEHSAETTAVVHGSGSSKSTVISTKSKATTGNDPAGDAAKTTTTTSAYTGGFVQNSKPTSSGQSGSQSGASANGFSGLLGAITAVLAMAGGVLAFAT